jgi:hypothetical protein
MTAEKQLIGLGTTNDSARSNISGCVIGGRTTEVGDAANERCGGAAIRGGVTFLNNVDNCYVFQCAYGFINTGSVTNAIKFSGTEFHKCGVGASLLNPQGVLFDQCTFENNDEHGMIIASSRSAVLNACYFEANHLLNTATVKADLLIDSSDPGAAITMNGLFFLRGGNTQYGLYVDRQRGVSLDGAYFNGYQSATNYLYAGSTSSFGFGKLSNIFANGTATRSINGTRWATEGFESSGVSEASTYKQNRIAFGASLIGPAGGELLDMFYSGGAFVGSSGVQASVAPPATARWAQVVVLGINYSADSGNAHVGFNLSMWDSLGNKIRTTNDVNHSAGTNQGFDVTWTGTAIQVSNKTGMSANQRGKVFVYFYK